MRQFMQDHIKAHSHMQADVAARAWPGPAISRVTFSQPKFEQGTVRSPSSVEKNQLR